MPRKWKPWKIRKRVSLGKYTYAVVPEHPNASKFGYVLEHRIVMENRLKRLLTPDEIVHHRNGDGKDNRPSNLELLGSNSRHSKLHGKQQGRTMVVLRCPWCQKIFEKRKGLTHLASSSKKFTSCGRSCGNYIASQLKAGTASPQLRRRLRSQVLRIYKRF